MILIDGKKAAAELREELKKEVSDLKAKTNKVPGLTVVLIGDMAPSQIYVRMKEKAANEVGLKSEVIRYPEEVEEKTILDACCGSRMFWYDKINPLVLFSDIREEEHTLCDGRLLEIKPDVIADFRNLPFDDGQFKLVVFDPPHLEKLGKIKKPFIIYKTKCQIYFSFHILIYFILEQL